MRKYSLFLGFVLLFHQAAVHGGWQAANPLPAAQPHFYSVVWAGFLNKFVAVSENRLATSADGVTWTSFYPSSSRMYALAVSESAVVAVGEDGAIVRTTDGVNWTRHGFNNFEVFVDVIWTGTRFVALEINGRLATSSNGSSWSTLGNLPVTSIDDVFSYASITWSGSQYVVVGRPRDIFTSTNGSNWVRHATGLSTSEFLESIAWNGSLFVAAGYNAIITSPDAVVWTTRNSFFGPDFFNVTWTGDEFLLFDTGRVIRSTDATDWDTVVVSEPEIGASDAAAGPAQRLLVTTGGSMTSTDGTNWSFTDSGSVSRLHINAVTWTGGFYVAVGDNGLVLTSSNGNTWTQRTSNTTRDLRGVAASGGTIVAVGGGFIGSPTVITSTNGIAWTVRTLDPSIEGALQAIDVHNGLFIAVGDERTIISSSNGADWTLEYQSDSVYPFSGLVSTGSEVLVVGTYAHIKSADGTTWGSHTNTDMSFKSVVWTGAQYVAVYGDDSLNFSLGQIFTSPDGTVWTERSWCAQASSALEGLLDVVWDGTQLLAVGTQGAVLTSANGVNWVQTERIEGSLHAIAQGAAEKVIVGKGGLIQHGSPGSVISAGAGVCPSPPGGGGSDGGSGGEGDGDSNNGSNRGGGGGGGSADCLMFLLLIVFSRKKLKRAGF